MNIYLTCISLDIIDMDKDNLGNRIKLDLYPYSDNRYRPNYCTFNLNGEFILSSKLDNNKDADGQGYRKLRFNSYDTKIVWIYSTKSKHTNKWMCKSIYKIPENFELMSISKYDKFYLFSNQYFYEWNMLTEKSTRIYTNKKNEVILYYIKIKLFEV